MVLTRNPIVLMNNLKRWLGKISRKMKLNRLSTLSSTALRLKLPKSWGRRLGFPLREYFEIQTGDSFWLQKNIGKWPRQSCCRRLVSQAESESHPVVWLSCTLSRWKVLKFRAGRRAPEGIASDRCEDTRPSPSLSKRNLLILCDCVSPVWHPHHQASSNTKASDMHGLTASQLSEL